MDSKNNQKSADLSEDELKARAEARLVRREEQKRDAPIAMHEYRSAEQALRDRTETLREQRLAREKQSPEAD